jgi:hypothetical protein
MSWSVADLRTVGFFAKRVAPRPASFDGVVE